MGTTNYVLYWSNMFILLEQNIYFVTRVDFLMEHVLLYIYILCTDDSHPSLGSPTQPPPLPVSYKIMSGCSKHYS